MESHRPAGILAWREERDGAGAATLPVIELLKTYFRVDDLDQAAEIRDTVTAKALALDPALEPVVAPVLALLDVPVDEPAWQTLDPARRRQRTLEAVRHLLLRQSQAQPLILVFEDLYWLDSESQAVLDGLVESLPTARILLLVNYRPEYRRPQCQHRPACAPERAPRLQEATSLRCGAMRLLLTAPDDLRPPHSLRGVRGAVNWPRVLPP